LAIASPRQLAPLRFTASRERAHSTEVESTKRRSSCQPGLWLANAPIIASIVSARRARRLWKPERLVRLGNRCPRRLAAIATKRASEPMPMIDCATQRGTTSASVNLRRAFFFLSGRRSSAVQNTAVSSRSRSASIVALLGSALTLSTADFDPAAYLPCEALVGVVAVELLI
jgi:hypothetical protein